MYTMKEIREQAMATLGHRIIRDKARLNNQRAYTIWDKHCYNVPSGLFTKDMLIHYYFD